MVLTLNVGAPELLDVETLSIMRKLVRRGALSETFATRTLQRVHDAPIARLSHRSLLFRAWDLRDSFSAYDACYIALAEQLGVPLLTCDGKLARAHGHHASIELFPMS